MGQPELEPTPMWDAGITGRDITSIPKGVREQASGTLVGDSSLNRAFKVSGDSKSGEIFFAFFIEEVFPFLFIYLRIRE